MFIDDAVIAGLIVVGGSIVFIAAVALFIYQDAQKKNKNP